MATPKKTHTTKKTPAKRSKAQAKARPLTWRFYAVTIGIFVIAVSTVIVIALLTASIVAKNANQVRLDRLNAIYASLDVGGEYTVTQANVFGDKRVHSWDKNRTVAASVEYLHGDTVSNTAAELDARIKAAGFAFVHDDTSDNGTFIRYHYKSPGDEYVRLTVVSKPFLDASQNAVAMNESALPAIQNLDTNAGPSKVTIKVNLDDNNE